MERFKRRFRRGFSLVELLVVIAIIALLVAIMIPSLGKAKAMAMRVKCAYNLRQINVAMNLYLQNNNDIYPCASDPVSTNPSYWLWAGRGWRRFVEPYIGGNIDANNPSVLLCPQDRTEKEKYESTSYKYSMAFYHSPQQIDTMNCTVTHQEQWDAAFAQDGIPQKSSNVTRPSEKILIGEWESNHVIVGYTSEDKWWCMGGWSWKGSRNYLFADGQVNFIKAEDIRKGRDGTPSANLTVGGISGRDWPRTD